MTKESLPLAELLGEIRRWQLSTQRDAGRGAVVDGDRRRGADRRRTARAHGREP
jgi:hypothetical protein